MSSGPSRDKELDTTGIEVPVETLPALPDDLLTNPRSAWLRPEQWFERPELPLEIEVGSGKATFLVQQAVLRPDINYLGFEYAREFFAYGADRIRRAGLRNVRMLHTDASEFLHWRIPDACAQVIHLYFPDPWPKSRHHRRRMVQARFLADARRILIAGGELRVVTDHAEYWTWMEREFGGVSRAPGEEPGPPGSGGSADDLPFERLAFERPASAREGEIVGTNFERKYRLEGREFHAAVLRKIK